MPCWQRCRCSQGLRSVYWATMHRLVVPD
jgi:hypothetical protein